MDFYREHILDHYKNPRYFQKVINTTVKGEGANPICGDELVIELEVKNNRIVDASFSGQGCAISQAAASLLLQEIVGKSTKLVQSIGNKEHLALLGIELSPARIKCALLSLKTIQLALGKLSMI
ncbi:iron-sulfur cluster assembly scaffold protein [Candidatus Daviesbacteria bacterium]|nr:iron-sulfur cluster assembly scaffold protein [Candidatus Daviesbacteria bacterium]